MTRLSFIAMTSFLAANAFATPCTFSLVVIDRGSDTQFNRLEYSNKLEWELSHWGFRQDARSPNTLHLRQKEKEVRASNQKHHGIFRGTRTLEILDREDNRVASFKKTYRITTNESTQIDNDEWQTPLMLVEKNCE